jgi:hypothetical protein
MGTAADVVATAGGSCPQKDWLMRENRPNSRHGPALGARPLELSLVWKAPRGGLGGFSPTAEPHWQ